MSNLPSIEVFLRADPLESVVISDPPVEVNQPIFQTVNPAGFATAEQGELAETALQPAAIANFETNTQLNARDTANRDRGNHTGTQAISTISGLQDALDGKQPAGNYATTEPETIIFDIVRGNALAGTELSTIESLPYNLVIGELILAVKTAPTGSTLIVDLNVNGTSILSTKISIDVNELTSNTAAVPYVLTTNVIAKGSRVTVDIDQIGATNPGVNPQLIINGVRG